MIFEYRGKLYPEYIRNGNACKFVLPMAQEFCKGKGFDVGCGIWPLPGAYPVDIINGDEATNLPFGDCDYIFSSHCLEHLTNPVAAIEHWKSRLKPGGLLFLYLPHAEEMPYWRSTQNRKHLHEWQPFQIERMLIELDFVDVIRSERDLAWSFAVVGFVPKN